MTILKRCEDVLAIQIHVSEDEKMQWEEKLGYPIINDIAGVKNFVKCRKGQGSITNGVKPHHDLNEIFYQFLMPFLHVMR